ncbi:hypothetical protein MIR68_007523 [Amoeboaphelidium protococcarum]|nr:hypothetical protein MIR68_007523 [Amoeboaphelidium protococcarum]
MGEFAYRYRCIIFIYGKKKSGKSFKLLWFSEDVSDTARCNCVTDRFQHREYQKSNSYDLFDQPRLSMKRAYEDAEDAHLLIKVHKPLGPWNAAEIELFKTGVNRHGWENGLRSLVWFKRATGTKCAAIQDLGTPRSTGCCWK